MSFKKILKPIKKGFINRMLSQLKTRGEDDKKNIKKTKKQ